MSRDHIARESPLQRLLGFLQQDPDNWSLRAEVFDAALAAGETECARAQVDAALAAMPDDATWKHRQALLLLSQSRYPEAQVAFEALIDQGHDDPVIRYNLAYSLFAQGQLEASRDILAPLLSQTGTGPDIAWVLWLRCQHRLNRLDEGLQAFVDRSSQGATTAEAWGVASLMALDAGRLGDARAWSERALRERGDQMEGLATRGSLALAEQDAGGALEWFGKALQVNAADGRSWSGLAFAKMLQMDLRAAGEAFGKAVSAMPDHIGTWIGLGWCQFLAHQPQAAREAFEQALRLDRNFGESHGALAVALVRLGQTQEARTEIEVALKLDPQGLSARYAQAMLSGEADDPAAFLRLSRRVLGQRPVSESGQDGRTLADVVFKRKQ